MRRITFISPIASVQGNMSGKQNLVYPLHDNKAFEGPNGSVNYARNYRPSFIGARRKSDGACSFQVKRRTANHLTPKAKNAMANLGGVGAIYSALVRNKSAQLYIDAQLCYAAAVADGYVGSFRKFMYSYIKPALDAKKSTIDIEIGKVWVSIDNPWRNKLFSLMVGQNSLIKFWLILGDSKNKQLTIAGVSTPLLFYDGDTWADVIERNYNVLGLTIYLTRVMYGELDVKDEDMKDVDVYTPIDENVHYSLGSPS